MRGPALLFATLSSFAGAQPHTGYATHAIARCRAVEVCLPPAPLSLCRIFTHMGRQTQREEHHALPGGDPGPLQPAATS